MWIQDRKLNQRVGLIFCIWVLSASLPMALPMGLAQTGSKAEVQEENSKQPQLINRSLISVGNDVYTYLDAEILIRLWNAIGDTPLVQSTNLLSLSELSGRANVAGYDLIETYPEDLKRLLFILFVWDEARRLNLFAPSEKSLLDANSALRFSTFLENLPPRLALYWEGLGVQGQRPYFDMALRARAFYKVRGDLQVNKRLSDTKWFWHVLPRG